MSELLFALCSTLALAAAPVSTLQVEATGFQGSSGHALARLYRPGQDVVREPWRTTKAAIVDGKAVLTFEGLEPGDYAVVVVHDVNDNGVIDHNVLHLPAEPLGFSNGFTLGLFSGKPTFEALRFTVASEGTTVKMQVR
jgi:uncharacterized protein (DUF2141 family)